MIESGKLYSPFSEEQYTLRNDDSLFRYFSLSPPRPVWITCHGVFFFFALWSLYFNEGRYAIMQFSRVVYDRR